MVDLSKVKVGDIVKHRDLQIHKVISMNRHDGSPYGYYVNNFGYTPNGHYVSDTFEHEYDIIEHIPQEVQAVENIDVTKIQVGDKLIFRGFIYRGENSAVVGYIKETMAALPYVVCFNLGLGFYSYTTEGNFGINEEFRWDIMKVERNGVTIMERKEPTVVNSDGSITMNNAVNTSTKQVYLINGKLFSTETLSTLNNLDLLKEIGVQVEVKDVL